MRWRKAASLVVGLVLISVSLLPATGVADQRPARIIFERSSDGDLSQIVSMSPTGSNQKVLLTARNSGLDTPSYSPDGRHIAFARYLHSGNFEIFAMKANGHHRRQITFSVQESELNGGPAWAPNGRRIAYASNRGSGTTQGHIFSVAAKGGRSKQLTYGSGDDQTPSYSPDGSQIVFSRDQGGSEKICVMSAHGGQVRCLVQVPNSSVISGASPTFSPDGAEIVFESVETTAIFAVNADGSGLRELAKGNDPDFSSSGDIVFVGGEDSSYGIYTMHSDGTAQTVVASGDGKYDFDGPSW